MMGKYVPTRGPRGRPSCVQSEPGGPAERIPLRVGRKGIMFPRRIEGTPEIVAGHTWMGAAFDRDQSLNQSYHLILDHGVG